MVSRDSSEDAHSQSIVADRTVLSVIALEATSETGTFHRALGFEPHSAGNRAPQIAYKGDVASGGANELETS